MPNSKKELKEFISGFPDLFSLKSILFKPQPKLHLRIVQLVFYFIVIVSLIVQFFNTPITKFILIIVMIIVEMLYLGLIFRANKKNPEFHETQKLGYFIKYNILTKTDFIIMINRIKQNEKNSGFLKALLASKSINKLFSIIVLPLLTVLIKPLLNILINSKLDFRIVLNSKILQESFMIIFAMIILTLYIIYSHIVNIKSQRNSCIISLEQTKNRYFFSQNSQLNIRLWHKTIESNEKAIESIMSKNCTLKRSKNNRYN